MIISTFDIVLFDLDGTLIDTAPDLGYALNNLLQAHGRQPLDHARIRPYASHGSAGLIKLGFGVSTDHPDYSALQQQFLQIYADNIARETRLFLGMEQVLTTLQQRGIRWGIVTNKPAFLTDPLTQALGLTEQASCIVSGDTTQHSKPHPEPLLYAAELLKTTAANCLYIGDAERDIIAAQRAHMRSVVALYGYLGEHDKPESWQADCLINHPHEILQWI
ncbi:MAG: phosphoglycolate phosphatase [Methylophaga sp.]|nr:phosphoglycolate phosphatase [Methylophaga sp.]